MFGNKASSYVIIGVIAVVIIVSLLLGNMTNNVFLFFDNHNSPHRSSILNHSYNVEKPIATLYQLKIKRLINSSFDPRYYVVLYSSYKRITRR